MYQILLIEDEVADVTLLQHGFSGQKGVQVSIKVIAHGDEALDYLLNQPEAQQLDLVIIDLNLPRISGHRILEEIAKTPYLSNLKAAVLSTSDQQEDVAVAKAHGVPYFKKPTSLEGLERTVKALIGLLNAKG